MFAQVQDISPNPVPGLETGWIFIILFGMAIVGLGTLYSKWRGAAEAERELDQEEREDR